MGVNLEPFHNDGQFSFKGGRLKMDAKNMG